MSEQYLIDSWVGGHSIQIGDTTGDVTITLERPSFRLELLQPSAPAELPAKVRRQPSFLLHPGNQVVPYRPPLAELRALTAWRDGDEPLSVLLLHGPGGQGKTRTAQYVASASAAAGWSVAQARDLTSAAAGPPAAGMPPAGKPPAERLLIVVDYAERWRYPSLLALLGSARGTAGARVVRVLLLARSETQLWDQLEAELDGLDLAYDPPIALTGFAGPSRETLFAEASEAFARALGFPELSPATPADLADPAYASPLTLHMAALAGVVAAIEEDERPTDNSEYLLLHEQRRWNASPAAGSMRAMAALATLFGPSRSNESARALLCAAGAADSRTAADRVLREYRSLYPSDRHLAPLRPDRFGEDFLGWHLRRDPAAGEDLAALLTEEDGPLREDEVRQAMIVLANAARHASVAELLDTVVNLRPELALSSPAVLLAVAEHLPARTAVIALVHSGEGVELSYVRLRLIQRIADDLSTETDLPIDLQIEVLSLLGRGLWEYGEPAKAADALDKAVGLVRGHRDGTDTDWTLRLADLLDRHATVMAALDREADSMRLSAEALELLRGHVPDPSDAEPDHLEALARVLLNYSTAAEGSDPPGALAAAEESVRLYRRLAVLDPNGHGLDLVNAEATLSTLLHRQGRTEEALETGQRAADRRRLMPTPDPATHWTGRAISLHNLGITLARTGQAEEAVLALSEAAEHLGYLAEHVPLRHLESRAECLFTLAGELEELGREEELHRVRRELLVVERRLRELGPEWDERRYTLTLLMLGRQLEDAEDFAAALPLLTEGIALARRLLPLYPGVIGILSHSLLSLFLTQQALGDEAAADTAWEALELFRAQADGSDPSVGKLVRALEKALQESPEG